MNEKGTPRWAAAVFKLILWLYPARFRDEWQDEMEAVLRSDRLDRDSPKQRRRFWIRTLASTLVTAPREHLVDVGFDLRYAVRTLRRRPVFLAVSVLSMAVGIGSATIVMATLSSLFLQPIPGVGQPEALVNVKPFSSRSQAFDSVSYPDYLELRDATTTLSELAAFRGATVTTRANNREEPQPVLAQVVSANYLSVLRVKPSLGRFFVPEEDRSAQPVAIVSHRFWENRLGSRPVLGDLLLNGERIQVIGVGPPGFRGNFKAFPSDLFLPLAMSDLAGVSPLDNREARNLELLGRLDAKQTLANAVAEFDRLGKVMARSYPDVNGDLSLTVERMTGIDADFRSGLLAFLLILFAITGLILAIAALNVAGMMASRAVERARETAVRLALGAPRHRLRRQLVVETMLLGLLAAALGVAVAAWGTHYVTAAFKSIDSRVSVHVLLDGPTLATAIGLAFLVAFGASLAAGSIGGGPLTQSQRGTSPKQHWRRALVVGQVLLSFVVLTCAAFFLRALGEAADVEIGFHPEPLAVTSLNPRLVRMEPDQAQRFFATLVDAVEELPAVESAALITRIPLGLGARFFPNQKDVLVPGHLPSQTTEGAAAVPEGGGRENPDFAIESTVIGEGGLETLGIKLAEGRSFSRADGRESALVAVINEVFARRFFTDREALGSAIVIDGEEHTIIGVARDSKYRTLDEAPTPFLYLAFRQQRPSRTELIVKARTGKELVGEAEALLPAIRAAQLRLAPDLPVQDLELVTDRLASSLLPQKVGAMAAGALGLLGLFLSAVGLTGVLAHWVDSRRREIGLRMSVGANPRQIMNLVLSQGATLTLLGVGMGVPFALLLSRALGGFLYGVSSLDPWTYLAVAGALSGTALIACAVPALSAMRVDPLAALRSE